MSSRLSFDSAPLPSANDKENQGESAFVTPSTGGKSAWRLGTLGSRGPSGDGDGSPVLRLSDQISVPMLRFGNVEVGGAKVVTLVVDNDTAYTKASCDSYLALFECVTTLRQRAFVCYARGPMGRGTKPRLWLHAKLSLLFFQIA